MSNDKNMTEAETKFVELVTEVENLRIRYQENGGQVHHYITALCTELAHCASAQPDPRTSLTSAFASSSHILDWMLEKGHDEAAKAVLAETRMQMEKEG